jgi:hypothetical protein
MNMSPPSVIASGKRRGSIALMLGALATIGIGAALWYRRAPEPEWERIARLHAEDVREARELAEKFVEEHEVRPWQLKARLPVGWTCRDGETDGWTRCRSDHWQVLWAVKEGADKTPGRVLADWAEQAQVRALQSNRETLGAPGFVSRATLAGYEGYITVEQTGRRPFLAYTFQGWQSDGKGGQRKLQARAETSSEPVINSLYDHPAEGLAVVFTTTK